jgi:hypothetical protein
LSKSQSPVKDILNKIPIQIYFDRQTQTAVIRGDKNKELPGVEDFGFHSMRSTQQQIFVVEYK